MKTIPFSHYTWLVTESEQKRTGSQESYYTSSPQNVWVDESGYLHLRVTHHGAQWNGARVSLSQTLGYGTYNFFLIGRVDLFEEHFLAMLSLDTDETAKIAIQFSRWTPAKNMAYPYKGIQSNNVWYSASGGNEVTLKEIGVKADSVLTKMDLNGTYSTHRIIWQPNSVSMLSLHGHYEAEPATPNFIIQQFQYRLSDSPVSDTERVTIGISRKQDKRIMNTSTDGAELVIARFAFTPA